MRPAHGTLRLLRTALLAAACTGLAWGGHNLWAAAPASLGGLAAATAVLFPLLWYFTRTMRGFGDIFAVMACVQILLHLVFQGSGEPVPGVLDTGADHTGHGLLTHTLGLAPGMLFAHLWAALLASALLAHGEAALWFLTALLTRALPPLRVPGIAFGARVPVACAASRTAPPPVALSAHGPRGPPLLPGVLPRRPRAHAGTYRELREDMTTTRTPDTAAPARALARAAAAVLAPLAAAALALAPSPALAHDVLTGSNPEDGATLDTVPEEVVLSFNNSPMEGGSGSAVVVTGPDEETTYEEGDLTFDGTDVSVGLAPLDQAGEYTIGFRVVSSDGHPIQDTLTFSVTEEAVAAAAPEPEESETAQEPAGETAQEQAQGPSGEANADEAAAEEESGGVSPVALAVVAVVAVAGIAAVVLVAVRMRRRPGGDAGQK
ncbi:copper resistance CopC family protein [Nocardiopsis dassonvillei]|uniref:copper resistance CopC family protein n=1 Tax=Nocardiopsis dassonvillei TaxID=2014 RepID=UPI003F548651